MREEAYDHVKDRIAMAGGDPSSPNVCVMTGSKVFDVSFKLLIMFVGTVGFGPPPNK